MALILCVVAGRSSKGNLLLWRRRNGTRLAYLNATRMWDNQSLQGSRGKSVGDQNVYINIIYVRVLFLAGVHPTRTATPRLSQQKYNAILNLRLGISLSLIARWPRPSSIKMAKPTVSQGIHRIQSVIEASEMICSLPSGN